MTHGQARAADRCALPALLRCDGVVGGSDAVDEERRVCWIVQVEAEPEQHRAVARRDGAKDLSGRAETGRGAERGEGLRLDGAQELIHQPGRRWVGGEGAGDGFTLGVHQAPLKVRQLEGDLPTGEGPPERADLAG
ncbi:hypothetical protein [Sorangium sp. So ce426]|uniref:hypothetical protein n=1 Tax=Sorangium sp. So ce426 TaxID=3133312 RepID=UPI003F5B35BD